MTGLIDEYQELKQRMGKLDFVDLLLGVRDLIRNQAHVRNYLQQRFTHIFVDEFQDTDPAQAEILLLLAADDPSETDWLRVRAAPGKLFWSATPSNPFTSSGARISSCIGRFATAWPNAAAESYP